LSNTKGRKQRKEHEQKKSLPIEGRGAPADLREFNKEGHEEPGTKYDL